MNKVFKIFLKKEKRCDLYRSCNEISIHIFNEIMTKHDLSLLKKNREDIVPDSILQEVWMDIIDEYFTLTSNPRALHQLKAKTKLMMLEKKIRVLEILKYSIQKNINVDAELKEYRVTKENISQHLGLLMNDFLKRKEAIPEEIEDNKNEFDKTIAVLLSRGFAINRFKTVVSEWVAMLQIVEQQNKANKE